MKENVYEDKSLQSYLHEIANTKTLSREEERLLAIKAKKGDEKAIQKLIESNLKFVVKIASRYQNRGLSLSELISEGNLGLIKAIEKYDPDREIKLISYAVWWIRQRILFSLAEKTSLIRVPLGQANTFQKIRSVQEKIRNETGIEASSQEIADKIDASKSNISRIRDSKHDTLSLDSHNTDQSGSTFNLMDVLADPSALDPKTIYYRDKTNNRLRDSIAKLDERSAKVIRAYFGLDGDHTKNFSEIAQEMGLSRERIRQIQKEALKKILDDTKEYFANDVDYMIAKSR